MCLFLKFWKDVIHERQNKSQMCGDLSHDPDTHLIIVQTQR